VKIPSKQEHVMDEFANKFQVRTDASRNPAPAMGLADKVIATGRDIQDATVDLANSSADAIKDHASHMMDAAKDMASQAGDRLQEKAVEQKNAGADYVNNLARTMRRAAGEFDPDIPVAGSYIRNAAARLEDAADALRDGDFNDLVQRARLFAKNQPTAFLGLAVLAGFGVVRFLKSSGTTASPGGATSSLADPSPSNQDSYRRPGTNP
jgi:hypothetical protein